MTLKRQLGGIKAKLAEANRLSRMLPARRRLADLCGEKAGQATDSGAERQMIAEIAELHEDNPDPATELIELKRKFRK